MSHLSHSVLALSMAFQTAAALRCDDSKVDPSAVFSTADGVRFSVEVVATNLEIPWSLAFAPDGRLFVTERPGRVRILQGGRLLAQPALRPIRHVPRIWRRSTARFCG